MGSLGCKHESEWVLAAATDLAMYLRQSKQVFSKSGPGDITCCFLRTSLEKAAKSTNLKKLHHLPPQLNKNAQDLVKPKYCSTFYIKILTMSLNFTTYERVVLPPILKVQKLGLWDFE